METKENEDFYEGKKLKKNEIKVISKPIKFLDFKYFDGKLKNLFPKKNSKSESNKYFFQDKETSLKYSYAFFLVNGEEKNYRIKVAYPYGDLGVEYSLTKDCYYRLQLTVENFGYTTNEGVMLFINTLEPFEDVKTIDLEANKLEPFIKAKELLYFEKLDEELYNSSMIDDKWKDINVKNFTDGNIIVKTKNEVYNARCESIESIKFYGKVIANNTSLGGSYSCSFNLKEKQGKLAKKHLKYDLFLL